MNECIRILKERRSVKSFEKSPVPLELLKEVLAAGVNAPTGMNLQSPVMVVVTNPEMIEYIGKLNGEVLGMDKDPFYGAPCVIIVFADATIRTHREDGCLVMGNLLNAATAVGLGSCWIHRAKEVFEMPEGKELMKKWGMDDRYVGIGNCILGYAKNVPAPKEHKSDYVIFD